MPTHFVWLARMGYFALVAEIPFVGGRSALLGA